MKLRAKWLGLLVGGLILAGCGSFWVNPYITVKESSLNWLEVHYYRLDRMPVFRTALYLNGTGYVRLTKGSSQLVSNDFAKRNDDKNWHDINTYTFNISPKEANDIFQHLVDYGVLDRDKDFIEGSEGEVTNRFLAVKANLCNLTYSENVNLFEEDPELAEQLLDVIRKFDNPALGARPRR